MNPTEAPRIEAILVSVGGTRDPVYYVLNEHKPPNVWYLCSEQSRPQADEIQRQLEWRPQARYIEVSRHEELGPCYRELRRKIADILAETKIAPSNVLVDYTGGTKSMSAALVLAAVERFNQFSYVGGKQREKGGLGIVVSGEEKFLYQGNPWTELAIREVERAKDAWDAGLFDFAASVLRSVAAKVAPHLRFTTVADVCEALACRFRLDFSEASKKFGPALGALPRLFDGCADYGLIDHVRRMKALCDDCQDKDSVLLRELVDNALFCARRMGRFEDAAARLYRAMELQAQIWLSDQTTGIIRSGRCRGEDAKRVPKILAESSLWNPNEDGEVRFSMENAYRALALLGHPQAMNIVTDIEKGTKGSRWRQATEKRNASILAHGKKPIAKEGFDIMCDLAQEFLGFDMSREANPVPPFDVRWLMFE